jgi:hypothetical protein
MRSGENVVGADGVVWNGCVTGTNNSGHVRVCAGDVSTEAGTLDVNPGSGD